MSIHDEPDADAELREADVLLHKADALLRRHRLTPVRADPEDDAADIPILTDVVEDFDLAPPPPEPAPTLDPGTPVESDETIELLVSLDTEITRELEAWFASEMPQLVSREFDRFSERLREEVMAHVRATLLPTLSERIAERLSRNRPRH